MPSEEPRCFCSDEDIKRLEYEGQNAAQDLAEWRSRGPRRATQELIDVIRADGVEGAVLLDIGAGVGIVHLLLLEAGAATAVDVDASQAYLAAARAEAERRGLADRVAYHYGDVVELAGKLPQADVVTLDSVICCYRFLPALLRAAVRPGPRFVGLTYPRDVWWMRAWLRAFNIREALRRRPGRYYIHRRAKIDRLMAEAGFWGKLPGRHGRLASGRVPPGVSSQVRGRSERSRRSNAADETGHLIVPVSLAPPHSKHSARRPMHVKHVVIPAWSAKGSACGSPGRTVIDGARTLRPVSFVGLGGGAG